MFLFHKIFYSPAGAGRKTVIISSDIGSSSGNIDASTGYGVGAGQGAGQLGIRIDPAYMALHQFDGSGTGRRQTRIEDDINNSRGERRPTRIDNINRNSFRKTQSGDFVSQDGHGRQTNSKESPVVSCGPIRDGGSVLQRLTSMFTTNRPIADESTRTLRGECSNIVCVPRSRRCSCDLRVVSFLV
jgi:hypothetical protein